MAEGMSENWFAWLIRYELDSTTSTEDDDISADAIFGSSQSEAIREIFRFILLAEEEPFIEYLMVASVAKATKHETDFLWSEFEATKARQEKIEAVDYRFRQKERYGRNDKSSRSYY